MVATPNILIMTAHDLGTFLSCYGGPVPTPHTDSIATSGCRFSQAFCTSPICSPARGSIFTGLYPQSNGLMGIIQDPYRWRFNKDISHLSHILSDEGFETVLINHQHTADYDDLMGFEKHLCFNTGKFKLLTGEHVSPGVTAAEEFSTFLQSRENTRPFYAQIGFFETHTPFDWNGAKPIEETISVPSDILDNSTSRMFLAGLHGAVASLDLAVGKILSALNSADATKNTIIIFVSDHGIQLPRGKWELYDRGIQVAWLIKTPEDNHNRPVIIENPVSTVDLVPTLLEISNVTANSHNTLPDFDGESLSKLITGKDQPQRSNTVFSMMHHHGRWVESRSIRNDSFKLIRNYSPSRQNFIPVNIEKPRNKGERPPLELYNLSHDPFELVNLANDSEFSSTGKKLDQELLQWLESVNDPIVSGPVMTPYEKMARQSGF